MIRPVTDRDTQSLLEEFSGVEGPGFDDLGVAEKRAALEQMLGAASSAAPDATYEDISIETGTGHRITGYVCKPEKKEQSLKTLLLIQGGGWAFARSNAYRPLAAVLAKELRCAVVCVDFRLAPEHPYPAGLDDCFQAYQWLRQNAGSFGACPDTIIVMGDSAGGNLAAALVLTCTERKVKKPESLVMVYPMTDISPCAAQKYRSRRYFGDGDFFLTEQSIEWAAETYTQGLVDRSDPSISLVNASGLEAFPPTTILVAGMDPLRDEGLCFADMLKEAGVEVNCRNYDNTIHGFLSFFHRIRLAKKAIAYIRRSLEHLGA